MNNRLEKQIIIPISQCDNNAHLNITGIFNIFMDIATEHGAQIGVGSDVMSAKGLFWVASKTKIKINSTPKMLSEVVAATWPETPNRIRCNRYYYIKDGKELLVEGKTEWIMVDIASGRPSKIEGVYPEGFKHCTDVVCDEPFTRLGTHFEDCEKLAEYTVCSTDIDMSQHMNNVAYIRAVLGVFSTKEIEQMKIKEIEVAYRAQCYEGEKLTFFAKNEENCREIGIIKQDGTTACVVRIVCG